MNIILIGNGPSALKYDKKFIHQFDNIGRFNHYTTEKHEQFIGSRVDYHITHGGIYFDGGVKNRNIPTIICTVWDTVIHPNAWEKLNYASKHDSNWDKNWILISKEISYFFKKYKTIFPSTGILAAMHFLYKEYTVYLLGYDNFMGHKHHYGDTRNFNKYHRTETEKYILHQLQKEFNLIML